MAKSIFTKNIDKIIMLESDEVYKDIDGYYVTIPTFPDRKYNHVTPSGHLNGKKPKVTRLTPYKAYGANTQPVIRVDMAKWDDTYFEAITNATFSLEESFPKQKFSLVICDHFNLIGIWEEVE